MPLYKALTASHLEAFNQDPPLVKETKEQYFMKHSPNFSAENTHDLLEVFWCMIMAAELFGSSIYKIRETWEGLNELHQAKYALRTLPKGLKFLWAVPPLESPKVMGLMGIYDPDTLCHFYGVTHCPWCGKVARTRAQSSTISGWYIIGWDWCVKSVMAAWPLHQRLSATMGG